MKKVLSVLLAAAMVMGMSVSAFAANFSVPGDNKGDEQNLEYFAVWGDVYQVRNKAVEAWTTTDDLGTVNELKLLECDELYFPIYWSDYTRLSQKNGAPSNWMLKIEDAEFVDGASFTTVGAAKKAGVTGIDGQDYDVLVKVEIADDFNAKAEQELGSVVEFYMYIIDNTNKVKSDIVNVHYGFEKYETIYVTREMAKEVIDAKANAYYVLADGINSLTAVFELDDSVLVTAKMWKGDKYMITSAVNAKWSKELSKQYDTDIELLTIESDLDVREVLFESAKDNKQVVEFVDGELVAVDSEFVTKYEVIDGYVLAKGYIADAEENGTYALISADIELIEVEEEATEEETKETPSTGANDFVGAAVALAVVSVAAAGALALKK